MRHLILAALLGCQLYAAAPVLFFTDLTSGPKTGGENNNGAYVTLYGVNFGASPTVTVGGGQAIIKSLPATYLWYQRMVIQLGANAVTGSIVLKNGGSSSNGLAFTVRAGNIYFVAVTGNDTNTGAFASPWATLQHAHDTMIAGDITYGMNGVQEGTTPNDAGSLQISSSGTAGNPMAIVAYPGATVTVGQTGTAQCTVAPCWSGIRNGSFLPVPSYWVFAELNVRGQELAMNFNGADGAGGQFLFIRLVGNDFSCPWGATQQAACLTMSHAENASTYGNVVHDVATNDPQNAVSEYHGMYFSSSSLHLDVGWNQIYNIAACIGLQFHSTADPNMYDINVHDNVIHDTRCDGILVATISPELGPVTIYNNVIYNAGEGWPAGGNPPIGGGLQDCIDISGGAQVPPDTNGTVPVEIYNNTLYNCGSGVPTPSVTPSGIALNVYSPNLKARMRNNIIYNLGSIQYTWDYNQTLAQPLVNLIGSKNLFFGSSAVTTQTGLTGTISSNPLLVNVAGFDFHLTGSSPAVRAGGAPGPVQDHDGLTRLSPPSIGAYDAGTAGATTVTGPNTAR